TYMVSEGGGLNFTETPTGLIFNSGNFRHVIGRGRLSFTHNGSTTAGLNIRIVTPPPELEAGFHAVLNLSGTLQAGTLAPSAGGPPTPVNDSTIAFDASGGQITAPGGLRVFATDVTLGTVTAGGLYSEVYRNFTAAGPVSLSGDAFALNDSPGAFTFNGALTA